MHQLLFPRKLPNAMHNKIHETSTVRCREARQQKHKKSMKTERLVIDYVGSNPVDGTEAGWKHKPAISLMVGLKRLLELF